ncbi:MAG: precorrin-3B C(17)-methyltransferase, partial [Acidimicrobiia bacterium]
VLMCSVGIAVRAIGPWLSGKGTDPAVVCVDDGGRWAIAVSGGHRGGANDLARQVAGLLGAEAVVTTATDGAGLPALDTLPGYDCDGDVAGVTRAWLDGCPPTVTVDPALEFWPHPLPPPLPPGGDTGPTDLRSSREKPGRVHVTDKVQPGGPGVVVLRPRSLVLGVGASSGADPDGLSRLVASALTDAGLDSRSVALLATVDVKIREPAVVALARELGIPLRAFSAQALAALKVPNPSEVVHAAVGTPSVSEAAALLAAGPDATLIVEKRRSSDATVAVARRARPEGGVWIVGLGPGYPRSRTPGAAAAVRHADSVLGYGPYVDLASDLLDARHQVVRFPIGAETQRARSALQRATAGERVALVCSGDGGVYAMASIVCELAQEMGDPPVAVIPGVTAALAAAALLGAPLGHDHAYISLSDLLTPWSEIETRLRAAGEGDFVVCLYNPRSAKRRTQLPMALSILLDHRGPTTPAAVVSDVGRPAEQVIRTVLGELDPALVGMTSLVIVGSRATRWIGSRMVTPRGYAPAGREG